MSHIRKQYTEWYCALYLWVWDESNKKASTQNGTVHYTSEYGDESYKKAGTHDDTVYCVLYLWVWDESYKKARTQDDTEDENISHWGEKRHFLGLFPLNHIFNYNFSHSWETILKLSFKFDNKQQSSITNFFADLSLKLNDKQIGR